jgi:hypothetical protein
VRNKPNFGSSRFSVFRGLCPKRHRNTPNPEESRKEKRRFRGVDATHVPAAGPASQQRRVHFRRCPEAVQGPNLLKTAPRRILTEGVRGRASASCLRPSPPVPGFFWFRARVILRTDGPTSSTQRLTVRGKVPTFPHPEGTPNAIYRVWGTQPPLLFSSCLFCRAVAAGQVRKNRMSPFSLSGCFISPGVTRA